MCTHASFCTYGLHVMFVHIMARNCCFLSNICTWVCAQWCALIRKRLSALYYMHVNLCFADRDSMLRHVAFACQWCVSPLICTSTQLSTPHATHRRCCSLLWLGHRSGCNPTNVGMWERRLRTHAVTHIRVHAYVKMCMCILTDLHQLTYYTLTLTGTGTGSGATTPTAANRWEEVNQCVHDVHLFCVCVLCVFVSVCVC
jgi:hypothetical protein